jgi:hypothetical protein
MSNATISRLYQLQHNESLNDAADRVYDEFPAGPRDSSDVTDALIGLIAKINLNNPEHRRDIAARLQKDRQHARSIKVPGASSQLELDLCTPDWANTQIIPLPDNQTVPLMDATHQHLDHAIAERKQNVTNAIDSLHRTEALVAIAKEPGGLAGGMKRRGVDGW